MIARIRTSFVHDKPVLPGVTMAVLFLSIPNIFTTLWPRIDPRQLESFWIGVGLILLPAIFSISVRTTLMLWLPFAALIPATMIYTLATESPLREWAFVVLMETDHNELKRFWTGAMVALVLAPLLGWFYYRFVSRHVVPNHRLGWLSRVFVVVFSLIVPLGNVMKMGWEFGTVTTQWKFSATFPVGPAVAALSALNIRNGLDQRSAITQNIQVTPPAVKSAREVYVLVIGESARSASFQLNGYARETTPLLAKTAGVLSYQDVIAPATVTLMSVPLLLTPATAHRIGRAPALPSIVSVFKRAGFHTAWLSTQRKHGMYDTACSIYSNDADESHFLSGNFAPGVGTYSSAFDGELINPVHDLIANTTKNLLIVLHTMGSHQHYCERYPPEFNHFPSAPAHCEGDLFTGKFSQEQITNLTNAYDNSIRYTDWVLAQLIETLKASKTVSALYFVADHGQNTGDSPLLPFAHGSATPDVLHVPMILWLSPDYRAQYADRAQALDVHVRTPISADTTFHTLIDMAALETPVLDRTRSAASSSFAPGNRMFRDLEGMLIDYDEALKRRDALLAKEKAGQR
jgi:glucan phosphoethanolaminetransferase (alkaline phosphatase superfamily)